jgi:hypothetical protein
MDVKDLLADGVMPVHVINAGDMRAPVIRELGFPHAVGSTYVMPVTAQPITGEEFGGTLVVPILQQDPKRSRAVCFVNGNAPVVFCHSAQAAMDQSKNTLAGITDVYSGALVPSGQSFTHEGAQSLYAVIGATTASGYTPGSLQNTGSATDPSAGGTIVALTGLNANTTYQVNWTVSLSGTVTAADGNNMKIVGSSGYTVDALYPGTDGSYAQLSFQVSGQTSLTIEAIAAASGSSAVYGGQIIASPISGIVTASAAVGILSERRGS